MMKRNFETVKRIILKEIEFRCDSNQCPHRLAADHSEVLQTLKSQIENLQQPPLDVYDFTSLKDCISAQLNHERLNHPSHQTLRDILQDLITIINNANPKRKLPHLKEHILKMLNKFDTKYGSHLLRDYAEIVDAVRNQIQSAQHIIGKPVHKLKLDRNAVHNNEGVRLELNTEMTDIVGKCNLKILELEERIRAANRELKAKQITRDEFIQCQNALNAEKDQEKDKIEQAKRKTLALNQQEKDLKDKTSSHYIGATLEGALEMGLKALASVQKHNNEQHVELYDILRLLKINVQNNEDFQAHLYPLDYPSNRDPDGPVSLAKGQEQPIDWDQEGLDDIKSMALMYVSGMFDHTLLRITKNNGEICYIHTNGYNHYPELLSNDEFYAYLVRYNKVVDAVQQIDIANMPAAIQKLKDLCTKPWLHGLVIHNCMSMIDEVVKAGHGELVIKTDKSTQARKKLGAPPSTLFGDVFAHKLNLPIPIHKLREVPHIFTNGKLFSSLKPTDNFYQELLKTKCIQHLTPEFLDEIQHKALEAAQTRGSLEDVNTIKLYTTKNQFYKGCVDYVIDNMDKVFKWQIPLQKKERANPTPNLDGVKKSVLEDEADFDIEQLTAKKICLFLQDKILLTDWKGGNYINVTYKSPAGQNLGETTTTEVEKKIPRHMIKMLDVIQKYSQGYRLRFVNLPTQETLSKWTESHKPGDILFAKTEQGWKVYILTTLEQNKIMEEVTIPEASPYLSPLSTINLDTVKPNTVMEVEPSVKKALTAETGLLKSKIFKKYQNKQHYYQDWNKAINKITRIGYEASKTNNSFWTRLRGRDEQAKLLYKKIHDVYNQAYLGTYGTILSEKRVVERTFVDLAKNRRELVRLSEYPTDLKTVVSALSDAETVYIWIEKSSQLLVKDRLNVEKYNEFFLTPENQDQLISIMNDKAISEFPIHTNSVENVGHVKTLSVEDIKIMEKIVPTESLKTINIGEQRRNPVFKGLSLR